MKETLICLAVLLAAIDQGWCYPEEYGPFQRSQEPKVFPLNECKVATNNEPGLKYAFVGDTNSLDRVVILQSGKDGQFCMALKRNPNEILSGYIKIAADMLYENGIQVYWGFFNEDNKPDYIVQIWCGGNGLNAVYYHIYFLLSSGNSFHCSKIDTFYPDPIDFIDINQDGRPEFVHTAFIYGEKGKDRKAHNYWVYNLLQFKGDQVVSANQLDCRFPCWVWYTDKQNHKNTSQLTGEQKQRLWKNQEQNYLPVSVELINKQAR